MSVVPDMTRVELSLVTLHDSYEDAYRQAESDCSKLKDIMKELHLDVTLPKTKSLDIEKKTRRDYDANDHYIGDIFLGFQLNHQIKIDLGMDNVLLNSVVRLIGLKLKQAEISIGHTVKDPRPTQLKLLECAVKDAKEKATIIANASGCKLGSVHHIDYSVNELYIYSKTRDIHGADEAMCCEPSSLDINPDDMNVSDSVTITWHIDNYNK